MAESVLKSTQGLEFTFYKAQGPQGKIAGIILDYESFFNGESRGPGA
jgi:hypothetical protein